jgi:hypothetical protein
MASARNPDTRNDRHPAQYLALAIGVIYTVIGIWGFFRTGFDGFAHHDGELLLGLFEVNPLHNIVHLVIGLAGIALWQPLSRARIYGWLLAVGYGAHFRLRLVRGQPGHAGELPRAEPARQLAPPRQRPRRARDRAVARR